MAGPAAEAAAVTLLHGTAIAVGGRAALIRGPSGSGKSDLALRCLTLGVSALLADCAALVADDQVRAERRGDTLVVSAPAAIRGLIEVRGLGIVAVPSVEEARLAVIADLTEGPIERLPEPGSCESVLGLEIPVMRLKPFEASAPAKLVLALLGDLARQG